MTPSVNTKPFPIWQNIPFLHWLICLEQFAKTILLSTLSLTVFSLPQNVADEVEIYVLGGQVTY